MTRARAIRLCGAGALSLAGLFALPALAAATGNVYVANFGSANVSQYDISANGTLAAKSPATVSTSSNPWIGVAVHPDGESAYVTNTLGSDNVSQYDVGADGALTPKSPATVAAGDDPNDILVSPDGESAYVVNNVSNTVSQYDVDPGDGTLVAKSTPTVATGTNPVQIAVAPDGESAYVTNGGFTGGDTVSQYDVAVDGTLSAKSPATVPASVFPSGIVVSPDGESAYVTNINAGNISQYDVDPGDGTLSAKTPATVPAGTFPRGIAVTPDGTSVYAANGGTSAATSTVSQYDIDPVDGTLAAKSTATVPADSNPFQIAISPDGGSAYVTNFDSGKVSQYDIDPVDGTLAAKDPATVAAGSQPAGIAAAPDLVAPTTTIDSGPSGTVGSPDASFAFSANEAGSTFECSLDGAVFNVCASPRQHNGLAEGPHSFSVRATDLSGNLGPAATRNWTVDTGEPPGGGGGGGDGGAGGSEPTDGGGGGGDGGAGGNDDVRPSNDFTIGSAKRNKKKGTAKLTVEVPGPGGLELTGKKLKPASADPPAAGEVMLRVKTAGKARKKLKRTGKAKVIAEVTFTPDGGEPNTQSRSLKLVKK